jgi:two-component system OmpR family response regulator
MTTVPTDRRGVCDVLIVEDDVRLADAMVSFLIPGGLEVRSAHSGSSALRMLERQAPRVAVLDYHLPDLTGLELAGRLRQQLPNLPIILMSGAVDDLEKEALEKSGIKVFVNKPLPFRALHRAILQLMRKSA